MKTAKYSIQVILNDVVNPIFLKANSRLLSRNTNILDQDYEQTLIRLKEKWYSEYNAVLDISPASASIHFNDNASMTSFLLKWS